MSTEAIKQMLQLLLTEPHAPTVCAKLELIAREALADHCEDNLHMVKQEQGEREAIAVWLEQDCEEQYLADRVRAGDFAKAIKAAHGIKEKT
jgi:cation transport regulator ChaC